MAITALRRPRRRACPRREGLDGLGAGVLAGAGATAAAAPRPGSPFGRAGASIRVEAALDESSLGAGVARGPDCARSGPRGVALEGGSQGAVVTRAEAAWVPAAPPAPIRRALRRALRSGFRDEAALPRPAGPDGARSGSMTRPAGAASIAASAAADAPGTRSRRL